MTRLVETPLLIVGAGPVGLALALDLGWRGQSCMLIDRGDGVVRYSKLGAIVCRTMEFCRRWGISDEIRNAGFPEDFPLSQVFCTSLAGHLIGHMYYPSAAESPLLPESPEINRRCPQLMFDPTLAAAVRRYPGVDLRYRCELSSFAPVDGGVSAEIRDLASGETFTVRARHLVGCDGPGSTVRRLISVAYEGDPVLSYSNGIYLNLPGLRRYHNKPLAERYVLVGPEGNWGSLTAVDGVLRWRLTINGTREKVEATDFNADWWVRRCLGSDHIPYEITDVMPWRRARLVAERFRDGDIFLAGDAAHIMAPNGGYGMNTGVADAVDLAWKLDAMRDGWGGPALLDSYEAERKPIGWRNVNFAASNFANANPKVEGDTAFQDGEAGEAARCSLGAALTKGTRAQWERLGVLLGYRYEGSPICVPDGTPAPEDDRIVYVPTSRPGHRAPHAWIAPGRSTLDLFGRGFVLLRFGGDAPDPEPLLAAARRRRVPVSVHSIGDPTIAALYERKLVLVRPDGHSAWRSDGMPGDPGRLIDIVCGAVA